MRVSVFAKPDASPTSAHTENAASTQHAGDRTHREPFAQRDGDVLCAFQLPFWHIDGSLHRADIEAFIPDWPPAETRWSPPWARDPSGVPSQLAGLQASFTASPILMVPLSLHATEMAKTASHLQTREHRTLLRLATVLLRPRVHQPRPPKEGRTPKPRHRIDCRLAICR